MSLKTRFILAAGLGIAALPASQALAGDVSVGGGLRTSFSNTDFDGDFDEDGNDDSISDFTLNSARLYISGKATDSISFMSLGVVNKVLEPWAGAVLAKIFVLVALILFIQRRPRGLFPQKGRAAES